MPRAFIELVRRRIHDAARKVVLIVDSLKVDRPAPVLKWLAEHHDSIEVVCLPCERGDRPPA
jgi:hypothetical protein